MNRPASPVTGDRVGPAHRVEPAPSVQPGRPEPSLGEAIHALAAELFPLCRSLAGPGVRQTLDIIDREIGLIRTDVPSGAQVLDWTVPQEWSVGEAWIRDPAGRVVVNFADCNLHVMAYSTALRRNMSLDELRKHILTLPDQPDRIPYRTAYDAPDWGFCMRHRDFEQLADGTYEVLIAAEHRTGHMSYGEHVIAGTTRREFLLSAHVCRPSLANDNCSGLAVLMQLARSLAGRRLRHTYRFLFAPRTIGAIAWLARHEETVRRIDHGLVVSCVGDGGGPTYKCSRRGDAEIDRAMRQVLSARGPTARIRAFDPFGHDERQFCSPGYDLPVGLFQRGAIGPEHHTSRDDLDFIGPEHLAASHDMILEAIDIIEADWTPLNLLPKGEPELGRRGLDGGVDDAGTGGLLWVLNMADGWHSLLDIAERSGLGFWPIAQAAERLSAAGLLGDADTGAAQGARPAAEPRPDAMA